MAENLKLMTRQVFAMIFIYLLTTPLIFPAQAEMRVVHLRSSAGEPAKLKFEIAGESIVPQKPFIADDDWLKELTWGIENSSDKSIICVEINLDFHGLGNSETERVYKFQYGLRPDGQGPNGEQKPIKTNEVANFNLSDAEYTEIKRFVEQKRPSEGVGVVMSVVEMRIAAVFFEDKSMWKDGKIFRPEPSNLGVVEEGCEQVKCG